jgi:hypothetical protein
VDDRPGFLAVLTASLALRSINILAVQVHTTEAGAVDDFLLDAPDGLAEAELLAAIDRGRGRDAWITRADAYDLIDPPTQMATLAARVTRDPGLIGATLGTLLGGCLVRHEPDRSVSGFGSTVMRVDGPTGGMIVLTRLAPAFTPAEFARGAGPRRCGPCGVRTPHERRRCAPARRRGARHPAGGRRGCRPAAGDARPLRQADPLPALPRRDARTQPRAAGPIDQPRERGSTGRAAGQTETWWHWPT